MVSWSDQIDDVLAGDLTAGLAYLTPAGGAVVTAVAPVGLRDRDAGTVTFTTSLGLGKKLERITERPQVALAYHAREHGFSHSSSYVLVQGMAEVTLRPDRDYLEDVVGKAAERFMGPPKRGRLFWDRWLQEYYADRVPVTVKVERIVCWPNLTCESAPTVVGAPRAAAPPPSQAPPANGTSPRVDAERAARRLQGPDTAARLHGRGRVPLRRAGQRDREGAGGNPAQCRRGSAARGRPPRGAAGPLYRAKLVGLAARQHTGWLEVAEHAGVQRSTRLTQSRASALRATRPCCCLRMGCSPSRASGALGARGTPVRRSILTGLRRARG